MKMNKNHYFSIKCLFVYLTILFTSCSCMGGKRRASYTQFKKTSMEKYVSIIDGEIIVNHAGYIASFNPIAKIPNWVAYELTKEETLGTVKRDNGFYPDPDLKATQATFDDYRNNNGWDKGHMAPAGDMKWSKQAMQESCYFTNICPQNHNLNNGDWKSLEEKCRNWAQKYGSITIICGPIIGSIKNGTLGISQVVIPDAFFKIILAVINGKYEGIGFVYQNKAGHKSLSSYAMSIDEIESILGYDFFPSLPKDVETIIESVYNYSAWE